MKITERLADAVDDLLRTFPGIIVIPLALDTGEVIVVDETGDGCYAYRPDNVMDALTEVMFSEGQDAYNVFCQETEAITDLKVASLVLIHTGRRICDPFTNMPLIPEDEPELPIPHRLARYLREKYEEI